MVGRGLTVAVIAVATLLGLTLVVPAMVNPTPGPHSNLPAATPATTSSPATPTTQLPPKSAVTTSSVAIGPLLLPPGGATLVQGPNNMVVAAGRDWTFTGFDQTQVSALWWGPAPALAVAAGRTFGAAGLAADGTIDTAGEGLTFSPSQPDLAIGKEYWTGSFAFNGTTYQSRLVVTVTNTAGTTPIPLVLATTVPGIGLPSAAGAVAPVSTDFKVNLKMQMQATPSVWSDPVTWYDALGTAHGAGGTLMSSFDGGFWYVGTSFTVAKTAQYSLANSDGATWQEIDPAVRLSVAPGFAQAAVVGGNIDLWTANAGYNQDVGIFMSDNGGADSLIAWKESGGFAGTFSPNAAFVQAVTAVASGHIYIFKLEWKTNKPASGATIFAGAGPLPAPNPPAISPVRLTAKLAPASPTAVYDSSIAMQHSLTHSDGATWQELDPALRVTVAATAAGSAVLGANVDLWTATAGLNQDVAIFVSDNAGADQLVGWKESGGFAGTFSPNAAYLQSVLSLVSGHSYVFKLMWKTNKPAGTTDTIFAGAGPLPGTTQISPTRLTAIVLPAAANPSYTAVANTQYTLASSDGATWVEIDPTNLRVTVAPVAPTSVIAGVNLDLWTANAGYNQDVALFVSDNGGADQLLGWKESGGFAGTFSPNAAFLQAMMDLTAGHSYVFKIKWKTNKPAGGATIFAGAGPLPSPVQISPTRLTLLSTT